MVFEFARMCMGYLNYVEGIRKASNVLAEQPGSRQDISQQRREQEDVILTTTPLCPMILS